MCGAELFIYKLLRKFAIYLNEDGLTVTRALLISNLFLRHLEVNKKASLRWLDIGGEGGLCRFVPERHAARQLRCPNLFQTNLSNPLVYFSGSHPPAKNKSQLSLA